MRFIINEKIESDVLRRVLTESFCPTAEKVLLIKNFLDKNFAKTETDDIGDDGYPIKVKSAVLVSNNNQPLKTFQAKELLLMLDDKFQKMISNESDRKKFLKQVISDWFNDRISKEGVLSVNMIKETENKTVRAYHASNSNFNNFDLGFVNTGNKGQAYGYGIYVSFDENAVDRYGNTKYVVEIPSDDKLYLNNFQELNMKQLSKIKNILYKYLINNNEEGLYEGSENELMQELNSSFIPMDGLTLYGTLSYFLGSDKNASEFCYKYLKKIGIKYKDNDVTNAVMFNPKDVKIIERHAV